MGKWRVASEPSNLSSELWASEWGEKESFYTPSPHVFCKNVILGELKSFVLILFCKC